MQQHRQKNALGSLRTPADGAHFEHVQNKRCRPTFLWERSGVAVRSRKQCGKVSYIATGAPRARSANALDIDDDNMEIVRRLKGVPRDATAFLSSYGVFAAFILECCIWLRSYRGYTKLSRRSLRSYRDHQFACYWRTKDIDLNNRYSNKHLLSRDRQLPGELGSCLHV